MFCYRTFSILAALFLWPNPVFSDSDSILILDDLQAPQETRCLGEDRGVLKTSVYSGGVGQIVGGERTVHCMLKSSTFPLAEVGTTTGLLMLDLRSSSGSVGIGSVVLDGAGVGSLRDGAEIPELGEGFKKPLDLSSYKGLVFQLFFDFALFQDSDVSFYLHSSPTKFSRYVLKLGRTVRYENIFLPLKGAASGNAISMQNRYTTTPLSYVRENGPEGEADLSKITGIRIAMNEDPELGQKSSVDMQFSGTLGGICVYKDCGTTECLTNSDYGLQNGCSVPTPTPVARR